MSVCVCVRAKRSQIAGYCGNLIGGRRTHYISLYCVAFPPPLFPGANHLQSKPTICIESERNDNDLHCQANGNWHWNIRVQIQSHFSIVVDGRTTTTPPGSGITKPGISLRCWGCYFRTILHAKFSTKENLYFEWILRFSRMTICMYCGCWVLSV